MYEALICKWGFHRRVWRDTEESSLVYGSFHVELLGNIGHELGVLFRLSNSVPNFYTSKLEIELFVKNVIVTRTICFSDVRFRFSYELYHPFAICLFYDVPSRSQK